MGWIIVLSILAVGLIAALIWDRRRRVRESLGGSPDEWRLERDAYGESQANQPGGPP